MKIIKTFYLDEDKKQLTKKQIIIKAIAFYVTTQIVVFLGLLFTFLSLRFFDFDTNYFKEKTSSNSFSNLPFYIAIIAPIYEEIAFRLGLSFKKIHIAISLSFLFLIFSSFLTSYNEFIAIKLVVCFFIFIIISFTSQNFWNEYQRRFGKQTIIFFTLLFALAHINNFDVNATYFFIYVFFCLPQLVMGIAFTYLRMNLSFISAVLMHILVNSFSILIN